MSFLRVAVLSHCVACSASSVATLAMASEAGAPSDATTITGPVVVVPSMSSGALIEDERNTIAVYETVAASAVFVAQRQVVRDRWTYRALEVPAGAGTGFVWDDLGHIVTNYHVVEGSTSLAVTLQDQRTYEARLVGGEPRRDIAVLEIDAPADVLQPVRLPEDGAQVRVGQKTVAIGNPFGLDHTVTTGIVSATGREVPGFGGVSIPDMIQTDASINPGNSGGPLLDSQGRLIGMNTMIYSQSGGSAGIGFAVPVSIIRRMVPQIIANGHVTQAGMGIRIVPDEIARRSGIRGVVVRSVVPEGPAAAAGLRGGRLGQRRVPLVGHVIVKIGDAEVVVYDDLYNALDRYRPGEMASVTVERGSETMTVQVRLIALN